MLFLARFFFTWLFKAFNNHFQFSKITNNDDSDRKHPLIE